MPSASPALALRALFAAVHWGVYVNQDLHTYDNDRPGYLVLCDTHSTPSLAGSPYRGNAPRTTIRTVMKRKLAVSANWGRSKVEQAIFCSGSYGHPKPRANKLLHAQVIDGPQLHMVVADFYEG